MAPYMTTRLKKRSYSYSKSVICNYCNGPAIKLLNPVLKTKNDLREVDTYTRYFCFYCGKPTLKKHVYKKSKYFI